MKQKYLEIGKITGTHGIKGMVRIQPWADSAEFLTGFQKFYLDKNGSEVLIRERIQPHGSMVIAKFKNINTIESAETFRNKILYIDRDDSTLPAGRYFVSDLIGCSVFDADTGKELGMVSDVSETGANDVWHITKGNHEYLFPAVKEMIKSVDIDNEKLIICPVKGIFSDEN